MYGQGFAGYGNMGGFDPGQGRWTDIYTPGSPGAGAGGIAGGSPWRLDEMTPRRWGSMTKGMQEQWMAQTARYHATEILTGGNAYTPLEKSIAAAQYNGSGVWSPNQQFVGKGQSWGGGGGGMSFGGAEYPQYNQNQLNEMMAQNQRWAMSNPYGQSGAGGNWGSGRMYGVA